MCELFLVSACQYGSKLRFGDKSHPGMTQLGSLLFACGRNRSNSAPECLQDVTPLLQPGRPFFPCLYVILLCNIQDIGWEPPKDIWVVITCKVSYDIVGSVQFAKLKALYLMSMDTARGDRR